MERNTAMAPKKDQVYYCPVCGAEIVVLINSARLDPVCCNIPMESVRFIQRYICPLCKAEVTILKASKEKVELICCNVEMKPKPLSI